MRLEAAKPIKEGKLVYLDSNGLARAVGKRTLNRTIGVAVEDSREQPYAL